MFRLTRISRIRAAASHLIVSALTAAAALASMLTFWYPPPYFQALGGMELALLIVGVDVALGPLLTLIVFKPGKKGLLFDLACIVAMQIGALGYGIHAMQAGRPVFTVFTGEELAVITAAEMDPAELAKGREIEYRELSLTGPLLVSVDQPEDAEERDSLTFAGLLGVGIEHRPRYYAPYAKHLKELLAVARTAEQLKTADDPSWLARAQADLAGKQRAPDHVRYIAVRTRLGLALGVIDATSGVLLNIL